MNLVKYIITVFVAFCFSFIVKASAISENFEKANKAYEKQEYKDAIDNYSKILKAGYESAYLYFNLGNSYFKSNDIANAIYFFEKAKRLNPSDEDIDFNLQVARNKTIDKIDQLPKLFIFNWWDSFTDLFSSNLWSVISIMFFLLTLIFVGIYLFSDSAHKRKLFFSFALTLFFFTVLSFVSARQQHLLAFNPNEAIIFTPVVNVKSSPDAKATDIFIIHEGTKVNIMDNVGDWLEIKLSNGSKGWVERNVLQIL